MIRLCSQCNTELNGANCAKKDARRFRKVCRSCYRIKRLSYRNEQKEKQKEHLKTLIDQQILKINFEPLLEKQKLQMYGHSDTPVHQPGLFGLVNAVEWIKDKLKRIKHGL